MRDINRLDKFYDELKKIHKTLPDWRFGQLVMNFLSWHLTKYRRDIFYLEEDKIIELFKEYLSELEYV